MDCLACGAANRSGRKFCAGCGSHLQLLCPRCGTANEPDEGFCGECGAALVAQPTPAADRAEARKVVTIIFADLIGSTSLHERLDAESTRRLMDRYYRALRVAVETHGGTIVKLLGDGVIAAFGVPRVAEHDAIRAVRAAITMQQAFRALASDVVGDIGLRVAVNTGEVVVSEGDDDVVGDPVNVAARLQQEAHDGDVLIGESTRRLVSELVTLAPFGVLSLKGRAETVAAYRVVSLERPAGAAATAFVGRDDELRRLVAVYDAAVATPAARLAVILGSPGLGKSRLLDEVARRLGGSATVLTAHCDAEGGATFAPIAKAVRELLRQAAPEPASPVPAQGVALGSGLAAPSGLHSRPSAEDHQPHRGQPHRGGHPIARGSAPGGGGAAEDLRAALDAAVPGADAERARIVDGIMALLVGSPASPEETFFIVRRFLAALAATQPVVLAIDDLQWAEPLLLDLVEHLVQWGKETRLLVLAAARPELRDSRSSLTSTGGLVSDVVTLGGLDAAAATRLAANVIGADALPAAVAGRVLATSEGNPLFLAELVRMLVNDGALRREGDRWTAAVDLAVFDMPPTIHALLAARIERLRPEDRAVLERAAVVGRQFSRSAVAHLLPRDITDLDARLESLRRSELIEPDASWFLGEPALRFHHGLTRDAAYRRVLKGTRAELHARLADWIESRVGEAIEHDETLGWHLEQAHQHLRELGPIDDHGRALGERAARYLAAAGRRALARDDLPVAANLLGRALHLLDESDPTRADLALDWCEALLSAGDVGAAAKAIDELARFIGTGQTTDNRRSDDRQKSEAGTSLLSTGLLSASRLRAWHTCFVGQLAVLTDPQSLRATADAVAAAAEELASAGDTAGEAKAHSVHAAALQRLGKIGACEAALDKALAAARRVDDRRRSNAVLAGAPLAALWGPSPVTRASGRCLDVVRVLRITQGAPAVEAVALRCQAVLEALRGRTAAARRMIASSRRMVEELGITQGLLETEMFAGLIELIEGDTAAAEHSLHVAYDGLRDHGLGIDAARAAGLLGITLLAQGRAAEAEALSYESEALAGDDLQAAITWRRVRAEALARRGERAAAVDFARAAVDIAAATDALLHHADARMALAAALRAAGRRDADGAAAEEARAIELWEAKGATVLAERARRSASVLSSRSHPFAQVGQDGFGSSEQIPLSPLLRHSSGQAFSKGEADAAQPVHRRVRPNAAIANVRGFEAAVAARDAAAFVGLLADDAAGIDYPTGVKLDRSRILRAWRSFLGAEELALTYEPLATLGESLALFRQSLSASAITRGQFDVGPYEREELILVEVDGQGRRRWMEQFAADRLGDAVARLYERYAELLPPGPERERAAATARSVATLMGPPDLDRWSTAFAPSIEVFDPRTVGIGSVHGAEAVLRLIRTLFELSADFTYRVDDILDLRSDALLVRWTNFGTDRASGGPFERNLCPLWIFGADGLVSRWEQFDTDRDTEALARFDELNPSVSPLGKGRTKEAQPSRRVHANAATANAARYAAAIAARDVDAIAAQIADDSEVMDHTTGATYDRQAMLATWRAFLRSQGGTYRYEPLATLGNSLALGRTLIAARGAASETFDVGAYEVESVLLIEVDAQGRRRRSEMFAADRLGDAVARLYERYADLLPEGPERARAAATARSAATMQDADCWGSALGGGVEFVDHRTVGIGSLRGAEAIPRVIGSLREVADDLTSRVDDILTLKSDAFLAAWTNFGTDRISGGAFERNFLSLCVYGTDGLPTRVELFDVGHDVEALARFDELVGSNPSVSPLAKGRTKEGLPARTVRRVRANAATANAARLQAALAARDFDALLPLFAEDMQAVHHPTGATYDRQRALAETRRSLPGYENATFMHEPLATLGESLALCRMSVSASGVADGDFDVGAYEREEITLIDVDTQGRRRRVESFAADHLGDAVVRLYERYAELLPDGLSAGTSAAGLRSAGPQAGPARARAAATARVIATVLESFSFEPDRWATVFAPAIEFCDPRAVGMGPVHGAEALLLGVRALFELVADWTTRVDDILDLRADALLVRWTNFGIDRASGGAFERNLCILWTFGADGLLTRWEQSEADRDVEALARFDELVGSNPSVSPLGKGRTKEGSVVHRRVRPNAATANAAQMETAIAARDAAALPALYVDDSQTVDYTTGATFDRQGSLATWLSLLRAEHGTCRYEPLATLGDALALCRLSTSASGFAGGTFDVGAYEREELSLIEVDVQGRRRRGEIFAADRLGDVITRLYERYAELLPEGPERARAAATARSIAALPLVGPHNLDRFDPTMFAPAFEYVDHRTVGMGTLHGAEALRTAVGALLNLLEDSTVRTEDVLALRPDAFLVRWTHFGADRASGGAFERRLCHLWVFGDDGLQTRGEQFDSEREDEALARFDELMGEAQEPLPWPLSEAERGAHLPPSLAGKGARGLGFNRRVRANTATASSARHDAAFAGGDADALATLYADEVEIVEHPTGVVYDREGALQSLRPLLGARDPTYRHEPLATLGDRLALCRVSWSASGLAGGKFDVGAYEVERLNLVEIDAEGRRRRVESFATDRLGDAVVRLYQRYADLLPDGLSAEGSGPQAGPGRGRAAATARSVAALLGLLDLDRLATTLAPAIEVVDHRTLGTWSAHGAEAMLQHLRSLLEVADDVTFREDEVLSLQSDALLVRRTRGGTERVGGGRYERQFLMLAIFGSNGLETRIEYFDTDRDDAALARFDALVLSSAEGLRIEAPAARFENAATRFVKRFTDAWAARDWEGVAASYRPGFQRIDRRAMVQLQLDRDQHVDFMRPLFEMRTSRIETSLLATRGNRLALARIRFDGADHSTGPTVIEHLVLSQVDGSGEAVAQVVFDLDDLDAAYAELDDRYAAGEAAPYAATWERYLRHDRATAAGDWEQLATAYAQDCVMDDHRPLGLPALRSRDEVVASIRAFADLRPDARARTEHVFALDDRRILVVSGWVGSEAEGRFEIPVVAVVGLDPNGHTERVHIYNLDQLDEARACYASLLLEGAAEPVLSGVEGSAPGDAGGGGSGRDDARPSRPDPLRIPPNAATRAHDRVLEVFATRDWPALRALTSRDVVWEDRQKHALLTGDVEIWISSLRAVSSAVRFDHELVATVGDRIALSRVRWTVGPEGGESEGEFIRLTEIDADGRIRAAIAFDLDDRRAAFAESHARFVAGEAAAIGGHAPLVVLVQAFAQRNWETLRGCLADDVVFRDHRTLGLLGVLRRDEWIESLRVQADLAPDSDVETLWIIAWNRHGRVEVSRMFGTLRDGGPFENVFLRVMVANGDRIQHFELFDVVDAERALARFEELCAARAT